MSTLLGGIEVADDVAVLTAELAESAQVADGERVSKVAG